MSSRVSQALISSLLYIQDEAELRFMVVGMPNVGKSSLINALRRNYLRKGRDVKV